MRGKKKAERIYHSRSDNTMLHGASIMHGLFVQDKAAFIAFDNQFSDPFGANWLSKISDCYDFESDKVIRYKISEFRDDVNERWEACRESFRDAKYFIKKAFPRNRVMRSVFGFTDFKRMNKYKNEVSSFMRGFYSMADKYKTELIASGYTQAKIDAILTLEEAFAEADGNMLNYKKERAVIAEERIKLLNEVWKSVQLVNTASKEIYKTDFAKLKGYLLPE